MKKLILTAVLMPLYSIYIFAQYNVSSPISAWSVKSWSTSGVYTSDSDLMNSKDIFDISNSMISFQYSPIDTNGAVLKGSQPNVIQGAFGAAIGTRMYIGLSVVHDAKLNKSSINESNIINNKKTSSNATLFLIRPVLRINKITSIEYMYDRNGVENIEENIGPKSYRYNFRKRHRTALSVKFNNGIFTIPLTLLIRNNNVNTPYDNNKKNKTLLDINPEFKYFLTAGPLTDITFKFLAGFDIKNRDYNMDLKNPFETYGGFSLSPSLYFDFANEAVLMGIKPELGLTIDYLYSGLSSSAAKGDEKKYVISPYLSLPFGSIARLGKYFEIRLGFQYDIMYCAVISKYQNEEKTSQEFIWEMSLNTGFGVNITKTASIDFMIRLLMPEAVSDRELFSLNSFGLQATFRF